jgi:excinuclease ABC subunit B
MPPFRVQAPFEPAGDQPKAIEALVSGVKTGLKHQVLRGLTGTGKTYVLAKAIERIQKPTLVVSHNKTLAAQLFEEFKAFFPDNAVEYFVSYYDYYQPEAYLPSTDTYIAKETDVNKEIERLRYSATQSLLSRKDVIVVASVSCIYGLGSPEEYKRSVLTIQKGAKAPRKQILTRLVDMRYNRNDMEVKPGTFRSKGDTIDVQQPGDEHVTRIELWGDDVERVSYLERVTGATLRELDSVTIFPGKHFVVGDELEEGIKRIEAQLAERLADLKRQEKVLEVARLEQRTRFDLEMLRNIGYCSGIENYSQPLSGRPRGDPGWCLLDYFPKDCLYVLDESHVTVPQIRGMYNGDKARKEVLINYGFRLPSSLDNRPLTFDEFEKKVPQAIYMSATPGPYETAKAQATVDLIVRPTGLIDPEVQVRPSKGQIDDLLGEIRTRVAEGGRVLVTTLTKRMAEDLTEYYKGVGVKVEYLHSDVDTLDRIFILESLRRGEFDVLVGINLLREGLDLPEVSLVAILDADKYGFLRSETSLIQTIGRAARNVRGLVLMYADSVTPAMKMALDSTAENRRVQLEFNQRHGIKPKSTVRAIRSVDVESKRKSKAIVKELPVEEIRLKKASMGEQERDRLVKLLETEMRSAAKDLDFERAALLRDKLIELKR